MIETVLIIIEVVFWTGAATVAVFGSPVGDAVQRPTSINDFRIEEPNIYFFGLLSITFCIFLLASWFKEHYVKYEGALTTQWMFMASMGFSTMISGLAFRSEVIAADTENLPDNTSSSSSTSSSVLFCEANDEYSCTRLIFAVTLGGISGAISCFLVPWKTAPIACQAEIGMLLLIAWACAIGFLTFPPGPAIYVSTMYISTYSSFFIALNILTTTSTLSSSSSANNKSGDREEVGTPSLDHDRQDKKMMKIILEEVLNKLPMMMIMMIIILLHQEGMKFLKLLMVIFKSIMIEEDQV